MPMVTKLDRVVTYLEGLLPIKLHDPLITSPCNITQKTKTISTIIVSMGTKHGRMMTYLEGSISIKSMALKSRSRGW